MTNANLTIVTDETEVKTEMENLIELAIKDDNVLDTINKSDLKNILFPVEKVKISDFLPNLDTISAYSYAVIGNINNTKTLLNCCSNRYELVPNAEIFPTLIYLLLEANVKFEIKTSINDEKTEFTVDFRLMEHAIKMENDDLIFPQLTVTHSYNGNLKYGVIFGYFRLICSNGLVVPVESEKDFNLNIRGKHTVSIQKSFKELVNRVTTFLEVKTELADNFKKLQDKKRTNPKKRIETILEKANIKNPAEKTVDYAMNVLTNEMNQLNIKQANDWLIYNAINSYIFNDDLNKKNFEVRSANDKKVFQLLAVA